MRGPRGTLRRRWRSPGRSATGCPDISLYSLALASHVRGDHEQAADLYIQGLKLVVEAGDKANAAYCLEGLAGLIAARDEAEWATRLFGASEALLESVGAPFYAHAQDRALYESAV
jgi:hypothetical protein